MSDPIQSSSSVPIPVYQTLAGTHDPLPPSSGAALDKSFASRSADDHAVQADDFKAFLDKTSVTLLEKPKTSSQFDPASQIAAGSVYATPDAQRPI